MAEIIKTTSISIDRRDIFTWLIKFNILEYRGKNEQGYFMYRAKKEAFSVLLERWIKSTCIYNIVFFPSDKR